MYTANSINCLCEALGMALPGNGTVPAVKAERIRLAKKAGETIMKLVENDIRPRMILKKEAFKNALAVDMAIGASTNTVLHLFAIAAECNITLTLDLLQEISDRTPNLCKLSPSTERDMAELGASGGIMAVMNELATVKDKKGNGIIAGDALTVTGKSISHSYSNARITGDAIQPVSNPISPCGGIAVLKGNIADDGAVVKRSAVSPNMLNFTGKAKCFDSEEDCVHAIMGGKIQKGDVIVIRYEGPKGGPARNAFPHFGALRHGARRRRGAYNRRKIFGSHSRRGDRARLSRSCGGRKNSSR